MTRRLEADEEALWAKVIASVTPLHPRSSSRPRGSCAKGRRGAALAEETPTSPQAPTTAAPARRDAGPRKAKTPHIPPPNPSRPPTESLAETLDGSWDRRLSTGRLDPDITIDLHGLSREAARHLLHRRVHDAEARGLRTILVITGKGHMPGPAPADLVPGLAIGKAPRGGIKAHLPRWLGEDSLSGRIAAVRRAHPKHGGEGAAYLILKRRRG
jgi:DNA-nicking Smr family endonuclease